jgi:hypothetical protein
MMTGMNEYRFTHGKEYVVTDGALACPGAGEYYDGPAEEVLCPEILRLAEENAALRKVIERDGDIRRVAPVLDAALKERDRLAQEVERLRERGARLRPLLSRCNESFSFLNGKILLDPDGPTRPITEDQLLAALRAEVGKE